MRLRLIVTLLNWECIHIPCVQWYKCVCVCTYISRSSQSHTHIKSVWVFWMPWVYKDTTGNINLRGVFVDSGHSEDSHRLLYVVTHIDIHVINKDVYICVYIFINIFVNMWYICINLHTYFRALCVKVAIICTHMYIHAYSSVHICVYVYV